jgi:hypothetical protein
VYLSSDDSNVLNLLNHLNGPNDCQVPFFFKKNYKFHEVEHDTQLSSTLLYILLRMLGQLRVVCICLLIIPMF